MTATTRICPRGRLLWTLWRCLVHVGLSLSVVEGIPGHGCFGQFKAATPSVGVSGQLYSTDNTEVASNVTPFLNRMLLMNGVIGKYVASKDTTARQPTATRAHWVEVSGVPSALTW